MSNGAHDPVVVVFLQTDFTRGESGYTSRCRDQVRFFSRRVRTIVYSFYEDRVRPWDPDAIARFRSEFPQVQLALDHRSMPLSALQRVKNAVILRAPGQAGPVVRMRLPGLTPSYDRIAREHPGALFFANLSEALPSLNGVPFARMAIDSHDVRFVKQARMENLPVTHPRPVATMRSEAALLSLAQTVVAITPKEQAIFRSLLPNCQVLFIPDFADRAAPVPAAPDRSFEHDLLFVGSEYAPNVDGLCGFLERHRAWLADYRVAVAGKVCEAARVIETARQIPSVRLLGFVDDLPKLYAASKLAISPVNGTGLKIKILEALAAGVPVFASAASIEGFASGYGHCVFLEEAADMARLLADPVALAAASAAALGYSRKMGEAADLSVLLSLIDPGRGR